MVLSVIVDISNDCHIEKVGAARNACCLWMRACTRLHDNVHVNFCKIRWWCKQKYNEML